MTESPKRVFMQRRVVVVVVKEVSRSEICVFGLLSSCCLPASIPPVTRLYGRRKLSSSSSREQERDPSRKEYFMSSHSCTGAHWGNIAGGASMLVATTPNAVGGNNRK